MTSSAKDVRDYLFRGLTFESGSREFRDAGLRVGADLASSEARLMEESLASFGVSLRNDAMQMGRIYSIIFCFENAVRELIKSRLEENFGLDWWANGISSAIRSAAESRQAIAVKDSWLEGAKSDSLGFVDFGHLAKIIVGQWDLFSDLIPSQHWLIQRMEEMEKARNFIAHNRMLLPGEFRRLEMYVSDWNRAVGL